MIKSILCFVTLFSGFLPLFAGTTTVTAFTDRIFNTPNPIQEEVLNFPDDGRIFEKVEVILTLEPPEGLDGDEWDRMGHIYMYDARGDWLEIARLITPFWNPPWTWTLDITEIQLLLRGEKTVGVWLQSWKDDGYQVSVSFRFTDGPAPPMIPVRVDNLWNGAAWGYGNVGNTRMEQFLSPVTVPIDHKTNQVLSRVSVTGHRFVDNTENAAEFLRRSRTLIVNGGGNWTNELWQLCGSWPVQPQSPGTWFFDRAGWCPGDLVDPWIVDVTGQTTPGQNAVIEYVPDEYINTGVAQDAMEQFGSQLVQLRTSSGFVTAPADPIHWRKISGQSFAGDSTIYTAYNFNASAIQVSASTVAPWLTIAPGNQNLNAGEPLQVDVQLNNLAENLAPGIHTTTLVLEDTTHGVQETRQVTLTIVAKKVLAHWRFEESLGVNATDASGSGNHGVLMGTDFATSTVTGVYGNALLFDGTDDLVNAGAIPLEGPFSVAAWVKPEQFDSTRTYLSKFHNSGRMFWVGQRSDGFLRFGIYPSIFQKIVDSTNPMTLDSWFHLTVTYDGHFQRIYIDGSLHATSDDRRADMKPKLGDVLVGSRNNNDFFKGTLDEVSLFNYDLSEVEIQRVICPADINGDATVSALDVPFAMGSWPESPNLPDLNYDQQHNILDILVLMDSFGACP